MELVVLLSTSGEIWSSLKHREKISVLPTTSAAKRTFKVKYIRYVERNGEESFCDKWDQIMINGHLELNDLSMLME